MFFILLILLMGCDLYPELFGGENKVSVSESFLHACSKFVEEHGWKCRECCAR